MKKITIITAIILIVLGISSFAIFKKSENKNFDTSKKPYKCMVQMKNYDEGGAYVAISLIAPDGKYKETLYVIGDDSEWYEDLSQWWEFQVKVKQGIDAISGESILTGDRQQISLKIDESFMNKGYKIRFETAVEDFKYHKKDAEIDFNSESLGKKVVGNGYIRYVIISK